MTVEELLALKNKIEAEKKPALECQTQGGENGVDNDALAQKLTDVRSRIRAAASASLTEDKQSITLAVNYFLAKQRFFKRPSLERPLDADAAKAYAELRERTAAAVRALPPYEWEALYLKLRGWSYAEISEGLGVNMRTICGRVTYAKRRVLKEMDLVMTRLRLLARGHVLDMRDPYVAGALLSVMTPWQAACFYLYYSENLSYRKMGELFGCGRSSLIHPVARALRSIDILLGEQDVILVHPEALDELGYGVYCELRARPKLVQAADPAHRTHFRFGREPLSFSGYDVPKWAVHVQIWRQENQQWKKQRDAPAVPHGRLLVALMEDGGDMRQEIMTVFSVCKYKFEQRRALND